MMEDRIQPLWAEFWRSAYPRLKPKRLSLDELRRLECAAMHWHRDVKHVLESRERTYGRKRR